jgi:hypothetical protein
MMPPLPGIGVSRESRQISLIGIIDRANVGSVLIVGPGGKSLRQILVRMSNAVDQFE